MDEDRFVISNELWEKIAPMLPGKAGDPGATGHDNRLFIESVYWRARTGCKILRTGVPSHGETFPKRSANGIRCSSGFADGRKSAYSSVFSMS